MYKDIGQWVDISDYIPITVYNLKKNKMEVTMSLLTSVNVISATRTSQLKNWENIIRAIDGKKASEAAIALGISERLVKRYIRLVKKAKAIAGHIEAAKLPETVSLAIARDQIIIEINKLKQEEKHEEADKLVKALKHKEETAKTEEAKLTEEAKTAKKVEITKARESILKAVNLAKTLLTDNDKADILAILHKFYGNEVLQTVIK